MPPTQRARVVVWPLMASAAVPPFVCAARRTDPEYLDEVYKTQRMWAAVVDGAGEEVAEVAASHRRLPATPSGEVKHMGPCQTHAAV